MEFIKKFKREFVYSVIIFVLLQLLQINEILNATQLFFSVFGLGLILIITAVFSTYHLYSGKKIQGADKVLIKIKVERHGFQLFLLPILFYIALGAYLYFNKDILFREVIVCVGSALFFILFTYIKATYESVYYIEKMTKIVFDFIGIILFFLLVSVMFSMFSEALLRIISVALIGFVILASNLKSHNQVNIPGFSILLLSTLVLAIITYFFSAQSILKAPLLLTVAFYLVVSFWNTKLAGFRSLNDYLTPVIFALMSLILIFSL